MLQKGTKKGFPGYGSHNIGNDGYGVPLPLHLTELLSHTMSPDPNFYGSAQAINSRLARFSYETYASWGT